MGRFAWMRPREESTPPPALDRRLDKTKPIEPITFVYTQRREPTEGPHFLTAPDSQFQALLPLSVPWQEAPDPIRQSNFYAEGNKIHPDAQMRITSHLAIAAKESVMQDRFQIGKLLGYIHRPMYAGGQAPSVVRANIQEAVPTTYGSQYEVQGVVPVGGITLATGVTNIPQSHYDGYPY
jgi:hypothetical protein